MVAQSTEVKKAQHKKVLWKFYDRKLKKFIFWKKFVTVKPGHDVTN